ncbi:methyl farnesoate epoxidase-like [Ischnura elegans]|uniref:methyl farnesoate epoxidase-like n=1 Tax=Ischnura elegans TaxID=197161 RepID=UPI001ED88270|nr:methyl farnesoate epoxidase-like [Ischnura elegans]
MELLIILAVLALVVVICMSSRKPRKFPPGPPRWPIVGNLWEIRKWGSSPHLAIQEVSKKYGEISGFYMGNNPIVVISGLVPIHEVSVREDFGGRPPNPYNMFNIQGEFHGITAASGLKWHQHRQFAVKHLANGAKGLEDIVHEEIKSILAEMEHLIDANDISKITPVQDILAMANLNAILHLIIGKRYEYSDPTLRKVLHNIRKIWSITDPSGGLFAVYPLTLHHLLPSSSVLRVKKMYNWLQYFFQEEFDQHRKTFEKDVSRDYIDAFIAEMKNQDSDPESTYTENQLLATCFEFLAGGTITTYNTLLYALLYMVLYPEIQSQVQAELDEVVGPHRLPSLGDRPKLCYTEATLLEVFRKSCVFPLGIPHASSEPREDVMYREYVIPKNARVILNIHGLHNDHKVWNDPANFRPARFLDEEGKAVGHDGLLPFGTGKRSCIGEAVAHSTLILFFSTLLLKYTFKSAAGENVPVEDPVGYFLQSPQRFSVQMEYRNQKK